MAKKKREHRKPSYPAALRMARIAFELPSHPFGWPLEDIQRELRISARTLRRYLDAARSSLVDRLGRPYFRVDSRGERPKLRLAASRPAVESTAYQAVSLHFTLALLKFLEGTVLKAGVEDLWQNFAKTLRAHERADFGSLDRKFYSIASAPKSYRGLDHILNPIVEGLIREYRLRIEYESGVTHEVDPYTLVAYRGGLYLTGKTHVNNRITTMAVERMRTAELVRNTDGSPVKFPYPAMYRPEDRTEGAFGIIAGDEPVEVEILIGNQDTEALLRARNIHPTQRFTKRRDRVGDDRARNRRAALLGARLRPASGGIEAARAAR